MSVQCNIYVLVGCVYEYKEFNRILENLWEGSEPFDDDFDAFDLKEPYLDSAFEGIKHHNGLCVITDGMNGEYQAVGRVLQKTKDWLPFNTNLIDVTAIDQNLVLKSEVTKLIQEQFNIKRPVVKTWVISHAR